MSASAEYMHADHRLRSLLFGDGKTTSGLVRGEDARLDVSARLWLSDDPERRAQDLNALLLGTCVGPRVLEKELHREFADLRERGEWFRSDPRLLRRIEALTQ